MTRSREEFLEQNDVKVKLMAELANAFKQATFEYPSSGDLSKESTQILCNTIEALFIHGLKTAFFQKKPRSLRYPEPNFWPFISKYTHKAVLDQIATCNQIKTEVGKSRAWIRILLNENTLENYLDLLTRSNVTLSKFYEKWAFLRDTERMNILSGYLKGLVRLKIEAPVNSFSLNTWTPTPLILSGLIAGEPARLKQLVKRGFRGVSLSTHDDTETAENALQSLYSCTEISTSSCAGDSDTAGREADVASVYSHPSMLDDESIHRPTWNSANSNVLSSPVPEDSIPSYDPHQIRVTRGTYRRTRRASKSGTVGSSSSSRNESISAELNDSHSVSLNDSHGVGFVEKVVKEMINVGKPGNDVLRTSSSICIPNENGENQNHLTGAYEENAVNMKQHKLFGSNEEIAIHKILGSAQNDSENMIGATDNMESKPSVQDESCNLQPSFCPATLVENEQFCSDFGDKTSKKSLDTELERSLSVQDELYVSKHCSEGNSLLGKGWIVHHRWNAEPFGGQTSTISSSTVDADSFPNFDLEIRNVLDIASNEAMDEKHSDSGSFRDEITPFEEDLLQHASVDDRTLTGVDDRTDREEAVLPDRLGLKIDSNGSVSQFSDKIINVLTVIPHEKGLDAQNFRCFSCRKSIGPSFASYRKCGFDEKYYCDGCFNKGDQSVIPSRLIRNWDGRPRYVCRRNIVFIENIRDKAVLRIDEINPQLYAQSHALNVVKFLREKLSLSVLYLQSCRNSVAEDLENRVWPKDYLYKDIHLYSFTDLLTVLSGYMENHLNNLLNFTTDHIRRCLLCSQKGFVCEICASGEIIYPFQLEMTSQCLECFSVYHKNCLEKQRCPKCTRRERYMQQQPDVDSQCLLLDMD